MSLPGSAPVIVAITGATGTIYGVRVLQLLQGHGVATHLVLSRWGSRTLVHETSYTPEDLGRMATHVHTVGDMGAVISSGSFVTRAMIVVPCSMRTLSAIAHGGGDTLIHRAADVILKERRRLVLAVRETPLHETHLENMLKLSRMGAVIAPPVPSFHNHPRTLDDLVHYSAVRLLDQCGLVVEEADRWTGQMQVGQPLRRGAPRERGLDPRAVDRT